jgi:hypothetical protein
VKLRWIKIVICLLPFLVPNKLVAESDCAPITSDVADRLANFVHDKFQFAPETVMKLTSSEVVGETCHRKLHFRSEGNGPVDIVFYLSPDLRFLSRDLLDSTVDAAAEKKAALEKLLEEQRLMQTRLISGKFPSSGPDTASILWATGPTKRSACMPSTASWLYSSLRCFAEHLPKRKSN